MAILWFENKKSPHLADAITQQIFSFPLGRGVAFHNNDAFFAVPIGSSGIHYVQIQNPSYAAVKQWVTDTFGDSQPVHSNYVPGTAFKRIHRPVIPLFNHSATNCPERMNESFIALRILLEKLEQLFEVVEPVRGNMLAYGHKTRELLLLACMEVESAWAAVLKENQYKGNSNNLTTKDYVKLCGPMLLDAYTLELRSYPQVPAFAPFTQWNTHNPTISLPWYDAYNKTKHNRESNLANASLENALHAVGAVVVMFYAQFGQGRGDGSDQRYETIRNAFRSKFDLEKYWKECYIPIMEVRANTFPKPCFPGGWTSLDFPF